MFTRSAVFLSLVLPALTWATPHAPLRERAGAAIGEILAGAPVSNISVRADNVAQCQTATISWSGATDPVSLFIAIGGFYVGETPITTLNDLRGGSTTYLINQAAGQTLEFRVTDAKGSVAYVQNIKVGGGDSWCLSSGSAGGGTTSKKATVSSSAGQTWSDDVSSTWSAEETAAAWSDSDPAPRAAATSSSAVRSPAAASPSTTKTSTSSSKTTASTSTTSASTTFISGGPPSRASTTSSDPSATLANAGAAASASKTGAASRDVVSRGSTIAALIGSVSLLGFIL